MKNLDQYKIGETLDLTEYKWNEIEFNKLLFNYFYYLNNGFTGWGISFIDYLYDKGWNHLGNDKFERIESVEEWLERKDREEKMIDNP